jgi:hypothetical protein
VITKAFLKGLLILLFIKVTSTHVHIKFCCMQKGGGASLQYKIGANAPTLIVTVFWEVALYSSVGL